MLSFQSCFVAGEEKGRSGDVGATQPKAAGSSLISQLTRKLAKHAIRIAGFHSVKCAAVLPTATGMTITLVLCTLRTWRPRARYVLFPRIDQKSCVKCILTAGYEVLFIDTTVDGDKVKTDVNHLKSILSTYNPQECLCILSTTSCFAPRVPDPLVDIAQICKEHDIPHVVNNAYGIQSKRCMGLVDAASRSGRIDVVVQSTDKNFLVPVGGAVLTAVSNNLIDDVYKMYPGRASSSPSVDLFITLLSMGQDRWLRLLEDRCIVFSHLLARLSSIASAFDERVLNTGENEISIAMSLENVERQGANVTFIGSMLFSRLVSGARVVPKVNPKTDVCGLNFPGGFGAHCKDYPCSYLTMACAIGVTRKEIDGACDRLHSILTKALDSTSSTSVVDGP